MSSLGVAEYGTVNHILPKGWSPLDCDRPALCGVQCFSHAMLKRRICKKCLAKADPPNQSSIIGENRR